MRDPFKTCVLECALLWIPSVSAHTVPPTRSSYRSIRHSSIVVSPLANSCSYGVFFCPPSITAMFQPPLQEVRLTGFLCVVGRRALLVVLAFPRGRHRCVVCLSRLALSSVADVTRPFAHSFFLRTSCVGVFG